MMLGWNGMAPLILSELDALVGAGSHVDIVVDSHHANPADVQLATPPLANQTCDVIEADPTRRQDVRRVLAAERYDHTILLCYRDSLDRDEAEAHALLTLLQIRHEDQDRRGNLVTELLQSHDVDLVQRDQHDEFIVSERLTSLLLAQLSENPSLFGVFRELFATGGVELRMRPVRDYLAPGPLAFKDVVEAARDHGDSAIGWRIREEEPAGTWHAQTTLNPLKSAQASLREDDEIVVLSRHQPVRPDSANQVVSVPAQH